MNKIAIIVSCLALIVSVITLWLAYLRKGKIIVHVPRFYSVGKFEGKPFLILPLAFVNTGEKARAICSIGLRIYKCEDPGNEKPFFWLWKELNNIPVRSGDWFRNFPDALPFSLDSRSGVSKNLLFVSPYDEEKFQLSEGKYTIEIWCAVNGTKHELKKKVNDIILDSIGIEKVNSGYLFTDYFKSSNGITDIIPIRNP